MGRAELGVRGTHTTLPQSPNGNERQMNRFYVQMKWQRERVLGAPKVGLRINKPLNIFLIFSHLLAVVDVTNGGQKKIDHLVVKPVEHTRVEKFPEARMNGLLCLDHKCQWVEERVEE